MAIDALDLSSLSRAGEWAKRTAQKAWDFLVRGSLGNPFSRVTPVIFVANLVSIIAMTIGVLTISNYQAWLVGTQGEALRVQGEIMATAIAWNSENTRTRRQPVDPGLISDLFRPTTSPDATGGGTRSENDLRPDDFLAADGGIRPQQVAPILLNLVRKAGIRARIYGRGGELIVDSDAFQSRRRAQTPVSPFSLDALLIRVSTFLFSRELPRYEETGSANGRNYEVVRLALVGQVTPLLLLNESDQHIVSVAVPIGRSSRTNGVLMLNTKAGAIDDLLLSERKGVVGMFLAAAILSLVTSLYLMFVIARPMAQLKDAAERVRQRLSNRHAIPDFSSRSDEVAHLAGSFRSMTDALCDRIEASEKFAADVSHELKNPLTSVKGAAEALALARDDAMRETLAETIQHDVRRLTRLIDDISKASRVGAEIAFSEAKPVPVDKMAETIVGMFRDIHSEKDLTITCSIAPLPADAQSYDVAGHDGRLAQVLTNLLDNAISFTPAGGNVAVSIRREGADIIVHVDDDGTGVPQENTERIFARFYTDRPGAQNFGSNSGLGLSISREIIEAHGGEISAENRLAEGMPDAIAGARFIITLPAADAVSIRQTSRNRWKKS